MYGKSPGFLLQGCNRGLPVRGFRKDIVIEGIPHGFNMEVSIVMGDPQVMVGL